MIGRIRDLPEDDDRLAGGVHADAAEAARRLRAEAKAHWRAWRRYLATRADALRYRLARVAIAATAALLAFLAAASIAVAAGVLLLTGLASLVAGLFPHAPGVGPFVAGLAGLVGLAQALRLGRRRLAASVRARLETKYADSRPAARSETPS